MEVRHKKNLPAHQLSYQNIGKRQTYVVTFEAMNETIMDSAIDPTTNGVERETGEVEGKVLGLSMAMVAVFFLVVLAVILKSRQRQRRRILILNAVASRQRNQAEKEKWEQRRYYTIDAWLVSKTVAEHDDICDVLRGMKQSSSKSEEINPGKDVETVDQITEEDLEQGNIKDSDSDAGDECPICFEGFEAGEVVSWSPNPKCAHVYHYKCISQWLCDHQYCPFCREVFLPVDNVDNHNMSLNDIPELIAGQRRRRALSFYCLEHKAVHIRPSVLDSIQDNDVMDRALKRACDLKRHKDLVCLRATPCPEGDNMAEPVIAPFDEAVILDGSESADEEMDVCVSRRGGITNAESFATAASSSSAGSTVSSENVEGGSTNRTGASENEFNPCDQQGMKPNSQKSVDDTEIGTSQR